MPFAMPDSSSKANGSISSFPVGMYAISGRGYEQAPDRAEQKVAEQVGREHQADEDNDHPEELLERPRPARAELDLGPRDRAETVEVLLGLPHEREADERDDE